MVFPMAVLQVTFLDQIKLEDYHYLAQIDCVKDLRSLTLGYCDCMLLLFMDHFARLKP